MAAIRYMEMPKSCADCARFLGACKYTDFGDYQTERNPNCPLPEIIFCENCGYFDKDGEYCELYATYTDKDFYCKNGKRSE